MEKITIEVFRKIKEDLKSLEEAIAENEMQLIMIKRSYSKILNPDYEDSENRIINELRKLYAKYMNIQNKLTSYDLSTIPFEEWQDFTITVIDEDAPFDFSNTYANIDFKLVNCDSPAIFKSCTIKNLEALDFNINPNDFDEEVVKEYPNLFLSSAFTEEFKSKYYECNLTIADLVELSTIQLNELKEKNLFSHLNYQEKNNFLINKLGIDKMITLYKYSKEEYYYIKELMSNLDYNTSSTPLSSNGKGKDSTNKFISKLKKADISEFKDLCSLYMRNRIINNLAKINTYYPEEFINENKDLFLIDTVIPEDVKARYFARQLTIDDLIYYGDVFQSIPIDYFMNPKLRLSQRITNTYGVGKFQDLVRQYPQVFIHWNENYDGHNYFETIFSLNSFLPKNQRNTLEKRFINELKKIYLSFIKSKDTEKQLPLWMYSIGFRVINHIETIDDLLNYSEKTILLHTSEQTFIDNMGINNIKRFEEETSFFSHPTSETTDSLSIFHCMCTFFSEFNHYNYFSINESKSYNKFLIIFANILNEMRKRHIFSENNNYDWLQGEFREKFPNIFIDQNAPIELKVAFYEHNITFDDIHNHPEYIPYLLNQKVSNSIDGRILLNTVKGRRGNFLITEKTDFIEVYEEKYGSEKLLKLIAKYGSFLDGITVTSFNNEMDKEEAIESNIRNSIIKKIIITASNYSSLSNIHEFVEEFPTIFADFSQLEIKSPADKIIIENAFYEGRLTFATIKKYPELKKILASTNLSMAFRNRTSLYPIMQISENKRNTVRIDSQEKNDKKANLLPHILPLESEDMLNLGIKYGKYLDYLIGDLNNIAHQVFKEKIDLNYHSLEEKIEELLVSKIANGQIPYHPDDIPQNIIIKYPLLFLPNSTDQSLKDRFYSKKMTIEEIINNPEILEKFGSTSITMGLSKEYNWITNLFQNEGKKANYYRLKVAMQYDKISNDYDLKEEFKNYLLEHKDNISKDNIDIIADILYRLSQTNSTSLHSVRKSLSSQLLELDNPLQSYERIENIFLKNNLPLYGKMFYCFQILYPASSKKTSFNETFDFSEYSRMAPELKDNSLGIVKRYDKKKNNDDLRFQIIYNDLLRVAIKSNSLDLRKYLDSIEKGEDLYNRVCQENNQIDELSAEEIEVLNTYEAHLEVLYENTKNGKETNLSLDNLNVLAKIKILREKFEPTARHTLKDRITRMFAYSAGYHSYSELRNAMSDAVSIAHKRGLEYAEKLKTTKFNLEEGDFIRSIGDYRALSGSLDNGNFSKEFLSTIKETSKSDTTPLDIDWTRIHNKGDIYHSIENTPTGFGFGNIYLVIKKDNPNLNITRDSYGRLLDTKYDPKKIEMFGTQVDDSGYETHWGSRTGIAMTDVDYILYKKNISIDHRRPYLKDGSVNYTSYEEDYDDLPIIKFEIARHGYYIPIVDFAGNLIFTIDEYENIKNQMAGLSYYEQTEYNFSSNLDIPTLIINETEYPSTTELENYIAESESETIKKRKLIIEILKPVFDKYNLNIKDHMNGDITPGSVEVIDTGSTSRNTNRIGEGDFDLLIRLDSSIYLTPRSLKEFQHDIKKVLSNYLTDEQLETIRGDLRYKGVHLTPEISIDLDITYDRKTDKVLYTTDKCVNDRLETIKKIDYEKYRKVLANIILAKKVLKDAGVYKSKNSRMPQGGLGGVGVETWILQHGGSFIEAAKSFYAVAKDKSFEEFKREYAIWDFGENHTAERKEEYLHDNFISDNMNSAGYEKMINILKVFIQEYDASYIDKTISENKRIM